MVAQQVGGKATRDALFLSSFAATELPKVMAAAALVSFAAVTSLARLMTRYGPVKVIPAAFLLNGVLFGLEFAFAAGAPKWVAVGVYLHLAVLGSAVISGFWSVVNERFDPHTAKHVMGRIAGGATFGGVVGGIAAERVASMLSMHALLLLLAAMNALVAFGVRIVGAGRDGQARVRPEPDRSSFATLSGTPYLRDMALLVGLVAVSSAAIDYVFKAEAATVVARGEAMLSFFAVFYTATSVLTFVVQSLITRRALDRLGLGPTVAILPGAIVVAGVAGAVFTRAVTTTLLRGLSSVLENSLFRSSYELLYTPVAPRDKRATKAIIDVAFDRVGTTLGSGLVLSVLFLGPRSANRWLLAGAVVIAGGALWIALRLHRGYVGALVRNLRSGALRLDEADVLDMTTRRTLAETAQTIDRDELLRQIDKRDWATAVPTGAHAVARPALGASGEGPAPPSGDESVVSAVADLVSRDPHRAHPVLVARPFDPSLTAFVIPLLADNELARPAIAALKGVGSQATGQLVDALLDPRRPSVVRRRLATVLKSVPNQRAERGLLRALSDECFDVRSRAAEALSAIQQRVDALAVSEQEILDVVRWELGRELPPGLPDAVAEEREDWSPLLHEVVRRRLRRHLEHVFILLSLVLDREALTLSLKALFGTDERLQGTALEYLDNVLPPDIREKVWARLALAPAAERPKRPKRTIVEELLRSSEALEIDLERLRAQSM